VENIASPEKAMKGTARSFFTACLAFAGGAMAAETAVVAQDLTSVRTSGAVSSAVWTRRQDSYTLQLVLPRSAGNAALAKAVADLRTLDPAFVQVTGQRIAPVAAFPRIQVWLLRGDGTQVLPVWRSADPAANNKCGPRCLADEVLYRFPVAGSTQAVAAAIQVGDAYYIEKLLPLAAN
jgi:hypothetical protein